MEEFRFWCQKVLPLVYDDSLSYYELLCKVVDYLNRMVENVNNTNENFNELVKKFNELKVYVDTYFENLDISSVIDEKIGELQADGYFEELVNITKFNDLKNDVNTELNNFKKVTDSIQLGSPSGSYSTYSQLQSAHPTGDSGFYIVGSEWYYWNGSSWVSGGTWNAPLIGKHSIEPINISGSEVFEYTSRAKLVDGYVDTNGVLQAASSYNSQRFEIDVVPNDYVLVMGWQNQSCGLFAFLNGSSVVQSVNVGELTYTDIENVRIIINWNPHNFAKSFSTFRTYVFKVPSNANKFTVNGYISSNFPDFRDTTYVGKFDLGVLKKFLFGYSNIFSKEFGKAYVTSLSNISQLAILDEMSYTYSVNNEPSIIWERANFTMCCAPLNQGVEYSFARRYTRREYGDCAMWNSDGTITIFNPDDLPKGKYVAMSDGTLIQCGLFTPSKDCIFCCSTGTFGGNYPNITLSDTFIGKPLYNDFPTTPYVQEINNYELLPSYKEPVNNVLKGAKITVIGDSITEKNFRAKTNWVDCFEKLGAVMQNLGKSGTGFINGGSSNNRYIDRITSINSDVEIIGVSISFNDIPNYNVGGVGDTTANNTVLGYANDFFKALIDKFPNVPIVCYTTNPWSGIRYGASNVNTQKAIKLIEGVEELCRQNGIAFKSIFTSTVLRPWIAKNNEFFFDSDGTREPDGTHPNSKGQMVLFKEYLPLFMEHYRSSKDFYE